MAPSKRRRFLGMLGVVLTPLVVLACNGIIGLGDFDRADCPGGGVCKDAGFGDTSIDNNNPQQDGDKPDGNRVDAGGSNPVAWAHFIMPNYAQPNDDAGPQGVNAQSYTVTTDVSKGVKETISGLVWHVIDASEHGGKSYDDAQKFCANLLPAGAWRLPTRIELVTLLDFSRASGALADPALGATEQLVYWTSSEVRHRDQANNTVVIETARWGIDFNHTSSGVISRLDPSANDTAAVRCIKAAGK